MYVSSTNNQQPDGEQPVAAGLRADLEQLLINTGVDLVRLIMMSLYVLCRSMCCAFVYVCVCVPVRVCECVNVCMCVQGCAYACMGEERLPLPVLLNSFDVAYIIYKVGQNRIYTPYMTVCLMKSLQKMPYIHHVYIWFWPTLIIFMCRLLGATITRTNAAVPCSKESAS